jgi:hypothetical protein
MLLRLLLLDVYVRVLWHGEAGKLETESSQGVLEPTARDELAGGFFALGLRIGCQGRLSRPEARQWANRKASGQSR